MFACLSGALPDQGSRDAAQKTEAAPSTTHVAVCFDGHSCCCSMHAGTVRVTPDHRYIEGMSVSASGHVVP